MAGQLITGGTVVTMSAAGILEGTDVLVEDGRIARLGRGIARADAEARR